MSLHPRRGRACLLPLLLSAIVLSWSMARARSEQGAPRTVSGGGLSSRSLNNGSARLELDHEALGSVGVRVEVRGDFDDALNDLDRLRLDRGSFLQSLALDVPAPTHDDAPQELMAVLRLTGAIRIAAEDGAFDLRNPVVVATRSSGGTFHSSHHGDPVISDFLRVIVESIEAREATRRFAMLGDLALTDAGATRLGRGELAGLVLCRFRVEGDLSPSSDRLAREEIASPIAPVDVGGAAVAPGPDIIVAEIYNILNYGVVNNISAIAIGTISCNVGSSAATWVAETNQHPVIAQNMYRMEEGRFEQIGMSWLKHGFFATSGNTCSTICVGTDGSTLGVNCSDPYSATLNGAQASLGPRWQVNAFTGAFPYPPANPSYSGILPRRLQVRVSDLDRISHPEALYFLEAHYVTPDDAQAGNAYNNASFRPASVAGAGSSVNVGISSATVRQKPALRAWKTWDPSVVETDVQVPGDGRFLLSAKATDVGGGTWQYEYALFNLNVHRSAGSFRVPIDPSSTLSQIGFHDVDYHSGEPFGGTDWTASTSSVGVSWATTPFEVNPNANALRWSTLYNFRFQANAPPQGTTATIGLFRPGSPTTVDAVTIGPVTNAADCNNNEIPDSIDIQQQTSLDCNENGVPDECEAYGIIANRIVSGLDRPVLVAAPPDDVERLFIVEQAGRVRLRKNDALLGAAFLDISALVDSAGERGLVGLAFHPNYATNRKFYVGYNNLSGATVIAEYQASANPDVADAGSAAILKTIPQDSAAHNGGHLQFGPDGRLYCGLGDSGVPNDPIGRGQDPASLLGKMLRLDVDNPPDYIPSNNPYVSTALPLHEIWAFGLRLPSRFGFDRATGDLYIGDAGQGAAQEINVQPGGGGGGENYGWRCMDGTACTGLSGCACQHPSLEPPVLAYPQDDDHCDVVGGFVYRGCAVPNLRGTYFYADRCSDEIISFRLQNGAVTEWRPRQLELLPTTGPITDIVSFGEDAAGELYIVSHGGDVFRIDPTGAPPPVCGNQLVESGESCDDGNLLSGDGCDALCLLEPIETNDDCANALDIVEGVYDFDTSEATTDGPGEPVLCLFSGDSQVGSDVWFRYTASCLGEATISLCGSSYNTKVAVYAGGSCPVGASAIACNDNACASQQARVTIPVSECGQYLIRVGGFQGQRGAGVLEVTCEPSAVQTDCNANLVDDAADIACGRSTDGNSNQIPDECESPGSFIVGGRLYDNWYAELALPAPGVDHPLWAYRPDTNSNPASGAATWRCKECHGWDYRGVEGQYGAGSHRTGFPGVLGTALSGAELFDLLREPASNGGGAGILNGHDFGSVLSDPRINDLVAFVLSGALETSPYISGTGAFAGDSVSGQSAYLSGGTISCVVCHGADGTAINFGTYSQPEYLGTIANQNPWEMLHKIRFGQPAAPMPSWLNGGGSNQGAADIGKYIQSSQPTECVENGQCHDGVDCTEDTCGPDGRCVFQPLHETCASDGLICNGLERCDTSLGCVSPGNPCSGTCDEGAACGCESPLVTAPGGRYVEITPRFAVASSSMAFVLRPQCGAAPELWLGAPSGPHGLAPIVSSRAQAAFLTASQWGAPVRVAGLMITPDTSYVVHADCGGLEGFETAGVSVTTARFGDCVGAYEFDTWQPPNGHVTFLDVSATVSRFRGIASAPSLYATDLFPCAPDQVVNFLDISGTVDGFRGLTYYASSLCPGPCW